MGYTTAALLLLCGSIPLPAATRGGYQPDINRMRTALAESRPLMRATDTTIGPTFSGGPTASVSRSKRSQTSAQPPQWSAPRGNRDSIWNGVLLGAAAGGGGGYLWAYGQCDADDSECDAIARPIGVVGGAAIGALVGGIVDALVR